MVSRLSHSCNAPGPMLEIVLNYKVRKGSFRALLSFNTLCSKLAGTDLRRLGVRVAEIDK